MGSCFVLQQTSDAEVLCCFGSVSSLQGRSLTAEETRLVADAIKKARIVGNHVYPGEGQSVLSFQ